MPNASTTPDLLARLRGFALADAAHSAGEAALSALLGPDGALLADAVRCYLLALVHERLNATAAERDAIAATFAATHVPAPLVGPTSREALRPLASDPDLPAPGRGLIVCDDLELE